MSMMAEKIPVQTNDRKGFTIVELLIVIVVIGILAAITIVAYNGVQRSARNAQTASAIEAYKKGLMAYAVINGVYPNYSSWVCLGQGYPGGTCWGGNYVETPGISADLRTTMGYNLPLVGVGGNATGPRYTATTGGVTVDGTATAVIFYMIDTTGDPNPKCPVGPIVSITGYPNLLSSNPVGATSNGGNQCIVPLPN